MTSGVLGEGRESEATEWKRENHLAKKQAYIQILGAERKSEIVQQAAATVNSENNSSSAQSQRNLMPTKQEGDLGYLHCKKYCHTPRWCPELYF
jgi:hypothetical protein